jgi:hypothetical protein
MYDVLKRVEFIIFLRHLFDNIVKLIFYLMGVKSKIDFLKRVHLKDGNYY